MTRKIDSPRDIDKTKWCTSTNFKLQILILKQHQIFQIFIYINFTNPLRKTIYPQLYLNIPHKFTKQPKTLICGMSGEIFDCLKRERDICVKTIINSEDTAFR